MVFRESPVRRVLSRSTGPEDWVEKAPEGRKSQESTGPVLVWRIGAQAPVRRASGRANGLSEGARLRSGRSGRVVGEPGDVCGRRFGARGDSREVRRSPVKGKVASRPGGRVRGPRALAAAPVRARNGNLHDEHASPRRDTIEVEPAGKQRPPTRRYGSPGGESSAGRTPGTSRHETRPRSFGAIVVSSSSGQPGSAGRRGQNRRGAENARGRHR